MHRPSASVAVLSFLGIIGLLLSVPGWQAYSHGRYTFWSALGGSVLLAGLPLFFLFLLIAPDLLHLIFQKALGLIKGRRHK
jgi:hypothetical protein